MALFKALPSRHLDSLLDGNIRFQSLAYYKQHELQGTVGDIHEATRLFSSADGLDAHNFPTNARMRLPASFLSEAAASEIFVFCLSRSYVRPDEISKDYDVSIELTDPLKFARRVKAAAKALPGDWVVVARPVTYYQDSDPPGVSWALPDVIATSKRQCFSGQAEYRLVLARRSTFKIENTEQTLQFGEYRPTNFEVPPNPIIMQIGSIRGICKVVSGSLPPTTIPPQ